MNEKLILLNVYLLKNSEGTFPLRSTWSKGIFNKTSLGSCCGRAIAQAVSLRLSHCGGPGSIPRHVGFVVDKVALGQVFSEYFGFPCQFSFHSSSSGAGTIGQVVADVPSGLSLRPPSPQEIKKKGKDHFSSCCKLRVCFRKVFLIKRDSTDGTKFNENLFILKAGITSHIVFVVRHTRTGSDWAQCLDFISVLKTLGVL
jgi:hypothetical protein